MSLRVKLVAAAAVLFLFLLVAPGVIGRNVEAELRQAHQPLADYLGVPIEFASFERGWFGSHATVCAVDAADAKFCARYDIQHGPLLRGGHWGLGWFGLRATPILDGPLQERFATFVDAGNPLVVTASADLGGALNAVVELARIDGEIEGMRVTSAAATGAFEYSPGSRRVVSSVQYPGLQIVGPQGTLSLDGFSGKTDGVHLGHGYMTGTGEASVESFHLATMGDGRRISLERARWGSDSRLDDEGKYSATMTADVGSLVVPGADEPSTAGLTFHLAGLNFAKMVAMQESQASVSAAGGDPATLLQAMQEVVVSGMTFDLARLEMSNSKQERINARLALALAPGADGRDPSLGIVQRLTGNGEIRCTRAALERFLGAAITEGWLAAGIAQADGPDLMAPLELAEAKLKIGKQTLPLPLLLALFGQKAT